MKRSIKTRLVSNFFLVILITVMILEVFLINAVTHYFHENVEEILSNQIKFSSEFHSRYFSSDSIEDLVIDDVDVFWQQTDAEVQIIDLQGNLLMDSIGVTQRDTVKTEDVKKALDGEKGVWIGNVDYDDAPVMAVSYPLTSDGRIIGIIRFITSLRETNRTIRSIAIVFIWIGVIVIFISVIVSVFLANSIIKPLKEVTLVAEKMADGQLKIRSHKYFDDEIGKLSDTLNYMAEELIKREQLKNDFISSISHELRTPLTSIKGWAITLKAEELPDNSLIKDGLDIIEKESDRLTKIVEELLDFSRFVSGRITLNKEEVNLESIMKQITIQLTPRSNIKDIELQLIIKDELPIIMGDANRIKQVFINLIDNSLKFSPEGGKITFSGEIVDGHIKICVEDNGCGIPNEELPYVKEKFFKGTNAKSNSGLGLSICDEIVKLHGGHLKIESKENVGTKVCVFLPIKEELS